MTSRHVPALLAALALGLLALPIAGQAQSNAELCAEHDRGVVNCGPGNNRKSGGGGNKVPHDDGLNSKSPATRSWPAISGILWQVVEDSRTPRDVLDGGPGNDWLYPSHGITSVIKGGPGIDYVWAYYGKGTIDCGPGIDTARIRTNGAFKTKGCEKIRHFCAHGENKQGQCLSPTGKPVSSARRLG